MWPSLSWGVFLLSLVPSEIYQRGKLNFVKVFSVSVALVTGCCCWSVCAVLLCVFGRVCISSGCFVKKRIAVSAGYHRQCSFQTVLISVSSLSFPSGPHIYQHLGILSWYFIHFVNLSFLHLSRFSLDCISFGLVAHYLFVQINIHTCTLLSHQRQSYLSSSLSCTLFFFLKFQQCVQWFLCNSTSFFIAT